MMTLTENDWQAGFAAGAAGLPGRHCPNAAGTVEAWSWCSGFVEGKALADDGRIIEARRCDRRCMTTTQSRDAGVTLRPVDRLRGATR